MQGFVNSLDGADDHDVHGWGMHLREGFPARREIIDVTMRLPIPHVRSGMLRLIVKREIDLLLAERGAVTAPLTDQPLLDVRHDPATKASRTLANIGRPALATLAQRKGVSVEALEEALAAKFMRVHAGE